MVYIIKIFFYLLVNQHRHACNECDRRVYTVPQETANRWQHLLKPRQVDGRVGDEILLKRLMLVYLLRIEATQLVQHLSCRSLASFDCALHVACKRKRADAAKQNFNINRGQLQLRSLSTHQSQPCRT